MAKLFRVILPVSDIDHAARFYGSLLASAGRRVSAGRHYFDCEGTLLACMDPQAEGDGYQPTPNPEHIYFAVDDLEATYATAREVGASFSTDESHGPMGEIRVRPWGERSFYVDDPFGNRICFVERGTVFTGA